MIKMKIQELKEMVLYFAHPYSGNKLKNYEKCNRLAGLLIENGLKIYSPISMTHPISLLHPLKDNKNFDWYTFDLYIAQRCDGIIVPKKWEGSKGCRLEVEYFRMHDKPVYSANDILGYLVGRRDSLAEVA